MTITMERLGETKDFEVTGPADISRLQYQGWQQEQSSKKNDPQKQLILDPTTEEGE